MEKNDEIFNKLNLSEGQKSTYEKSFYLGTESVNPLLTDFYQFSMIYAHWKNGRCDDHAVFDMYFRKCPFNMNLCILGGVDECFEFLSNFKFAPEHITYLKTQFPGAEEEFFDYLSKMDMDGVKVYGFTNADFVIANEPLLTLEGPMSKVQLVETTLLNMSNYPTLIATLALKLRTETSFSSKFHGLILVEDGSANAQSPNGAYMGIKYSAIGGVNSTTNLLASKNLDLELFIKPPLVDIYVDLVFNIDEDFILNGVNLLKLIKNKITSEEYSQIERKICKILFPVVISQPNNQFTYEILDKQYLDNELDTFTLCVYALSSVIPECQFILSLNYTSAIFDTVKIKQYLDEKLTSLVVKANVKQFVKYDSKMIEDTFDDSLIEAVDGIILGSEFIVSNTQPALGMVYKINEVNGRSCIKFSEEKSKQTIPGFKTVIRLFDVEGKALADFMCLKEETGKYLNLNQKEIKAYHFDEFTQLHQLSFSCLKVMNNLIFENGRILPEYTNVNNLRQKVLQNHKFYKNQQFKLYISEGIRNIIVEETQKMQEISHG